MRDAPNTTSSSPLPLSETSNKFDGVHNPAAGGKVTTPDVNDQIEAVITDGLPIPVIDTHMQGAAVPNIVEADTAIALEDSMTIVQITEQQELEQSPSWAESPIDMKMSEPTSDTSVDKQLSDLTDGDSDPYEPPEATPSVTHEPISTESPPFSPAPPQVEAGNPTDIPDASTSSGNSTLSPPAIFTAKDVPGLDAPNEVKNSLSVTDGANTATDQYRKRYYS